ncbi:stage III sporulation protein SpoIIIAB [Halonatronum saccharophilum]|uniref:stage III sporulation protein SpoIIIAB n=1 Tax=Halonatronum saccharophilum TaxID=150060 RepID=UPI00047F97AF|nr:stage III sporulation protein SpoIIIAB [Halonatronum saccharophilum]
MRLLGATLIIFSSSMIGFLVAKQFILRPKQLGQLQTALQMLETEISYGFTPLPEAFSKLSSSLEGPIANIFARAKEEMEKGERAQLAWQIAIKNSNQETALLDRDIEVLKDLSHNLGASSGYDQVKYLNLVGHKLESLYQEAVEERRAKVKLWRYLGVLGGLALTILIF